MVCYLAPTTKMNGFAIAITADVDQIAHEVRGFARQSFVMTQLYLTILPFKDPPIVRL